MKQIGIILSVLLLFSLAVGFIYGRTGSQSEPVATNIPRILSSTPPQTQVLSPTTTPARNSSQPATLLIPKLDVQSSIESVGLDSKKNMDVPKDAMNVGWYNLGVRPGQKGNAVMAGHLDTVSGSPAVFYKLDTLQSGDEIIAVDGSGKRFTYRVTAKQTYETQAFPLQDVFGVTDKSRLNLITCSGQFNNAANNYSHRTVVYSELVQ